MTSEDQSYSRGERPCWTWYGDMCIISETRGERSKVCNLFKACLYAKPRSSFTADELELLDAWCQRRVCLIVYRPQLSGG
jgi:hypothetical protein